MTLSCPGKLARSWALPRAFRRCAGRFFFLLWAAMACLSPSLAASAPASASGILWGVNESGLDFGKGPIAGTNFWVPNAAYYLARGVRLIRVPFEIDRIQPQPDGPLSPAIVSDLKTIIAQDRAAGALTVLDPHGYGFYPIAGKAQDILKNPAATADYLDLMRKIATVFAQDDVAIGLMNEPHTGADADYGKLWNQAIASIRAAGFHGVIVVPHCHWSTAADIQPDKPFTGNIVDPDHNWVLELHLYLDPDNTGTYRQPVVSPSIGTERLAGAIAWSRQSKIRLFLGETGVPADPVGLAAFQAVLDQVAAAPDVFWGAAIWGAGAWWNPKYVMRLDPVNGVDRPQFTLFENIITPELLYFARDPGGPDPKVLIRIDGVEIAPPTAISALRNAAPQAVAVRAKLTAGVHRVEIRLADPTGGSLVYVVDSTWKGLSNGDDAYGIVTSQGYLFRIKIPN